MLRDLVHAPKSKFHYEYDFGDGWAHTLLVEKIIPAKENPKTFVCLAGKGRCPPEDCGGIWGYYDLLEILSDVKHPEHEERMEWIGGPIDPDAFDPAAVTNALTLLAGGE